MTTTNDSLKLAELLKTPICKMDGEVIDEVACKARTCIPHYKYNLKPTGKDAADSAQTGGA